MRKAVKIESVSCENNLHTDMDRSLACALIRLSTLLDTDGAADALELRRQCKQFAHARLLEQFVQKTGSTIGCFILLPPELMYMIVAQMKCKELHTFASTCKQMYDTYWEDAPEEPFKQAYLRIEDKKLERPKGKSYKWCVLAHRVVDDERYFVPLISPCNFGNYTGDWLDGQRSGFGVINKQGKKYTGRFLYGVRHGFGTIRYETTKGELLESYTGKYKYGMKHGNGRLEDEIYIKEGTFVCDSFISGTCLRKKDGTKFVGDYNSLGRVTRTYKDGTVFSGQATSGYMHGECTIIAPGWSAEVLMRDDEVIAGEYKLSNGDSFIKFGKYKNILEGYLKYSYADGSVDVGVWKNGKKKGLFFHYDCDGNRTLQKWKDGKLV